MTRQLRQWTALFILALWSIPPVAVRLKLKANWYRQADLQRSGVRGLAHEAQSCCKAPYIQHLCNFEFVESIWDLNHDSSGLRSPGCFQQSVSQKDPWHSLTGLCNECRGTVQNSAAISEHNTKGPSAVLLRLHFTSSAHNRHADGTWWRSCSTKGVEEAQVSSSQHLVVHDQGRPCAIEHRTVLCRPESPRQDGRSFLIVQRSPQSMRRWMDALRRRSPSQCGDRALIWDYNLIIRSYSPRWYGRRCSS